MEGVASGELSRASRRAAFERSCALVFSAAVFLGCSSAEDSSSVPQDTATPEAPATGAPDDHPPPLVFSVRGRLDDASDLTYRLEPDGGPLDSETFHAVIAEAAALWSVPGRVAFRSALDGEPASITLGWRSGAHERGCPTFGVSHSVAHTGPTALDTFVHFDAGRRWREARGDGPSLRTTAAHELGHVLGLGHVSRGDALLFPDPRDPSLVPTPSDWAGIHSLYGTDGDSAPPPGSIATRSGLVLHGVVPPQHYDWTLFDVDGDEQDELVTWRTDPAGQGTLAIFRFAQGPVLSRTIGPFPGVTSSRAQTFLGHDAEGERCLLALFPDGRYAAFRFDHDGVPKPRANTPLRFMAEGVELVDADGDQVIDGEPPFAAPNRRTRGDLDGDGDNEELTELD